MKYKILEYLGNPVNIGKLMDGIYTTNSPYLFSTNIDLDSALKSFEFGVDRLNDVYGNGETFKENFLKCQLVEYELIKSN